MNKISKLLLNDYLLSPNDMRLQIFVNSINNQFVFNKKSALIIKQMVEDAKEGNKLRIKILEDTINADKTQKITPSKIKKMGKIEIKQISKENEEENNKAELLRRQITSLRKQTPTDMLYKLEAELREIESRQGMFDPKPAEISQMDIILGLLGHWEREGTIANELIYGHTPRIQIRSSYPIDIVLGWLTNLSGLQLRNWIIQNDMVTGDSNSETIWTLSDRNSGIGGIMDNNTMKVIGGQNGDQIVSGRGLF